MGGVHLSHRRRWLAGMLVVPATVLSLVATVVTPASAVTTSYTPPLPSTTGPIPVTEDSIPFGPAFSEGAALATDLAKHGYVEEEYFVTGSADLYEYDASGEPVVAEPDVDYTTRILVRKPIDPSQFSGTVHVDAAHPQFGIDGTWVWARNYMVQNGDAFVSLATRRGGFSAIEFMKQFDPVRYDGLNFPDGGLNWDVIGQVGNLLKSDVADNPLHDYAVDKLFLMGVSGGAAVVLLYISDGFHERARLQDGSPIYDGFLLFEPSGYPRIRDSAAPIPADDPRQQVQPRDVPAIMLTGRMETGRFRPDSDAADDRFRLWEVAGMPHADANVYFSEIPVGQQLIEMRAFGPTDEPQDCVYPLSTFPIRHFVHAALYHLEQWSGDPTAVPPRGDRLTGGTDAFGNPAGGIRNPYVDVPVATYTRSNQNNPGATVCPSWGATIPFDEEQLRDLYQSKGDYVRQVNQWVKQLVDDGWLLRQDAAEVRRAAAQFDGFR